MSSCVGPYRASKKRFMSLGMQPHPGRLFNPVLPLQNLQLTKLHLLWAYLDSTQNPYVMIISVAHPLVIQSVDSSLNLKTSTLYLHNTGADILANQIVAIIEHVVEKPSMSPNNLSFLPHTLQSRDDCCAHSPSYTHTKPAASVVEYVICCSIATPNKIAIKFFSDLRALDLESVQPGEFITYAKLHRCSNQFTCYLVKKGIEWEDHITVCSQCGANFHIVMFGVLKAGVIGIMQFRINLPYELQ